MHAVLTGGTGAIGQVLTSQIASATVLTRSPQRHRGQGSERVSFAGWDPYKETAPITALQEADVVFNLAGESVAEGRWNDEKKRRIRESRLSVTRNLVAGLRSLPTRPPVLVSASAVGFYGDRGDEVLDEESEKGVGFLADVCQEWEHEAMRAREFGVRVVCVRVGIVLAKDSGALERMLPPFRLGVGGKLGDGEQWMPWIHIEDIAGIMLHAARTASLSGVVNGTSPEPAKNRDFTQTLGEVLRRPTIMAVPRPALRLALGEMSNVVLASQRAYPRAVEAAGYTFKYRELKPALEAVV